MLRTAPAEGLLHRDHYRWLRVENSAPKHALKRSLLTSNVISSEENRRLSGAENLTCSKNFQGGIPMYVTSICPGVK